MTKKIEFDFASGKSRVHIINESIISDIDFKKSYFEFTSGDNPPHDTIVFLDTLESIEEWDDPDLPSIP